MLCFASAYLVLMQSFCYEQRDRAGIHSMTSLQAILTEFNDVVAHAQ